MSDGQPQLDGLVIPEAHAADSAMVKAAKATLAELRRAGRVSAKHAVQVQLVLSLAEAIDKGARTGRASAVAMAAGQLNETMDRLDPPDENSPELRDRLAAFMETVERAANNGGQP
jgi:hypothetical protein